MANTQGPWGFRPVRRLDSASPTYGLNQYQLAYNNSHTIGKGDVVNLLSTGYVDKLAPGTTNVLGIFWGCEYYTPGVVTSPWFNSWTAPTLASTAIVTCWVIDDPKVIFEVQSGTVSAVTQGNIGNNIQFATATPSTATGISAEYVDSALINTTPTLPFRIVGLSQRIGNDNASVFNTVEVVINFSQLNSTTGI